MTDEASFLKAIADQPAERSTRLVFADWLDEHGRPREAEFLRLQLEVVERTNRLLELGGQIDAKWLTAVGDVKTNQSDFVLQTKRWLALRELRQWNVYEGLLEGLPTAERNPAIVQRIVTDERNRGDEPFLIPPLERPIPYEGRYPFGTPSAIPSCVCIARFTSFQPARDTSRHASQLTVIWFQHEFAFPIDAGVREQIRAIEWEKHAHDFDW